MAKKNNDDIDDNDDFNDDKSEDINDADDNFGLPDIEYSPVNREEEKEEPAQDEPAPEEPAQEKPSPFESIHKRDVIYSASSERLSSEWEEDRSSGYSGYVPPRKESNAPKIIILLGILLLVAAGIWYFGIYKPEQDRLQAQQEQELREEEARVQREAQADMERQQKEEADREAARLAAEAEAAAEAKTGSFETIPERTGRYYIVVASALDVDLATDYAKNLAQEGQNAKILAPKGRNQFHRVAVGDYENLAGAQAELNEMRSRYGDEVWVVKF